MKRGMGHGRRDSSQRRQKEVGRQGAGMENRQRKRQGQLEERQAGGTEQYIDRRQSKRHKGGEQAETDKETQTRWRWWKLGSKLHHMK